MTKTKQNSKGIEKTVQKMLRQFRRQNVNRATNIYKSDCREKMTDKQHDGNK